MIKLCFVDLETTGVDPQKHGILAISGIIQVPGKEKEKFSLRVKPFPEDVIDPEAIKVSGLNPEEGMAPREAHLELLKIFGKYVDKYNKRDKFFFVAYNARFDYDFLRRFFDKLGDKYFGSWFWYPPIDVMQVAILKMIESRPAMENFKLGTVCKANGIVFDSMEAHGAAYDVTKTTELYERLLVHA